MKNIGSSVQKILKEIPSIDQGFPKHSSIYLFGSVLFSEEPQDIDILVVYNINVVQPDKAWRIFSDIFYNSQIPKFGKIHLNLLTREEEKNIRFIETSGAKLVHKAN